MRIIYFAHPLRGANVEATRRNRERASELVAQASLTGEIAPVCSWIVLSQHWSEEEGRELGLKIDCALIDVCQELWLCGPAKSLSAGMQIEHDHAVKRGLTILDMRGVLE